jgi:nucleoside-diphosphate-sugar epimerase
MNNEQTALVIGAKGGIGGEVTAALRARGWTVRALVRNAMADTAGDDQIVWIAGDAMRSEDVLAAAAGATLIVHAANPPGYRDWERLAVPMLDNTIAAAKAVGASILFPGTIYNFGPDAFPVLREDSPQHPQTRKGAIRVAMEGRLRAAASAGVPVLIVRAGDFFGPRVGNNWFSQALVKPGRPVRAIVCPGAAGVGHAWAYLPDLADAMVRLVERGAELETFAVFHFAGHWDPDGTQMAAAIRRVVGNAAIPVRRFPWMLVRLASPFVALFRELQEMRGLWQQPLRLDNTRLTAVLGAEPHTRLDLAVRRTLDGLGCLPAAGRDEQRAKTDPVSRIRSA